MDSFVSLVILLAYIMQLSFRNIKYWYPKLQFNQYIEF